MRSLVGSQLSTASAYLEVLLISNFSFLFQCLFTNLSIELSEEANKKLKSHIHELAEVSLLLLWESLAKLVWNNKV